MASMEPPASGRRKQRKKKRERDEEREGNEGLQRVDAWWILENKNKDKEKEDDISSVMLKFVTKQPQYAIPQASIAVKENIDSEGLNNLVYTFLEKARVLEEIPSFEFMIDGKILINTVGQFMKEAQRSYESTIEVEYFERHPPPTPKDNLEHDDWVSSVMCSTGWLLTGCYDNTVQLWSCEEMQRGRGKRAHKLTIPAHKAPVKAVAWVSTDEIVKTFVSCSIDQTSIVWEWDSKNNSVECVWECRGHTQSIECLGVESQGTRFATGSWDNAVKIWDADPSSASNVGHEDEPEKKKVKKKKQERLKTPLMTLVGHSESVSGVSWMSHSKLLSCSWDHSIRLWDMNVGGMVSQISGNVAFFCLSYSKLNNLLLAGCADRHIRLYDTRANEGSIVQNKFSSHSKWVPSVRWSNHDEHLFVSGGFDTTTRVWDSRSAKSPLYNLLGHSDKVLCVDWSSSKVIASGSADCTAQVYSV